MFSSLAPCTHLIYCTIFPFLAHCGITWFHEKICHKIIYMHAWITTPCLFCCYYIIKRHFFYFNYLYFHCLNIFFSFESNCQFLKSLLKEGVTQFNQTAQYEKFKKKNFWDFPKLQKSFPRRMDLDSRPLVCKI